MPDDEIKLSTHVSSVAVRLPEEIQLNDKVVSGTAFGRLRCCDHPARKSLCSAAIVTGLKNMACINLNVTCSDLVA